MRKLKESCESDIRMFSARMYNIRDETLKTIYHVSDRLSSIDTVDTQAVQNIMEEIKQITQ